MTDGRKTIYRWILIGDRHYTGKIIKEDKEFYYIKDKFGNNVSLGKAHIILMEELI